MRTAASGALLTSTCLIAGLWAGPGLAAENSPLALTANLGLQHREVRVSDPVSPYKSQSNSASASLSRRFDPLTMGSLSLSYSIDRPRATTLANKGEIAAGSAAAAVSRYIGGGRVLQGMISYGRASQSNLAAGVHYENDANMLAVGGGIVQMLPLGENLSGTVGLSAFRTLSYIDDYVTSSGTYVDDRTLGSNIVSLSGGLQWALGRWTPNLGLALGRASQKQSLSDSDRTALSYSLGLGYALDKQRALSFSYGGSTGLKNVRDSHLGVGLSFPF